MRRLTVWDSPIETPVEQLAIGDVIYIPLRGKRIVAATGTNGTFLDFPKRPRVSGSPLAGDDTSDYVTPDPSRFLGLVQLTEAVDVIGRSDDSEMRPLRDNAEAPGDAGGALADIAIRLRRLTGDLVAAAERRSGKPIRETLDSLQRSIAALQLDLQAQPESPEQQTLLGLVGLLGWSHQEVRAAFYGGTPVSLAPIIGAVQNYDDDL